MSFFRYAKQTITRSYLQHRFAGLLAVWILIVFSSASAVSAQTAPSITSVTTPIAFGGFAAVAPGSWVEIKGADLAPNTQGWTFDQFLTPQSSNGINTVSVTVGGQAAFVSYISPGQVNAQLPAQLLPGTQPLTVTNANGTSLSFFVTVSVIAPGLWSPPSFNFGYLRAQYAGALFPDGVTYALPPGAGVDFFVPAKYPRPGDVVTMYGVGFGPVDPRDMHPDEIATRRNRLQLPVHFFYGHNEARVLSAELAPNLRGFYRFEIQVPEVEREGPNFDRDLIPLTFAVDDVRGAQELTVVESNHNATAESIEINGVTRTYDLYVPESYQPGNPLLIAIHGHGLGGPGTVMEVATGLNDFADREGFAVAYPDGTPEAGDNALEWNAYFNNNDFLNGNGPDDVGFIRGLIDSLQSRLQFDSRRVYVAGLSNGGQMTHRIGVELSDKVAAIAALEGGLYGEFGGPPPVIPDAAAPISVLMIEGDGGGSNSLYCGLNLPQFSIFISAASQDFDYWAGPQANKCAQRDSIVPICLSLGSLNSQFQLVPGQPSAITEETAFSCKENAEVKFYRLLGGEDHWYHFPMNDPSQIPFNPYLNHRTGITTNEIVWNFFKAHPKREH